MHLAVDGETPVPRFVMVDDIGRADGYYCALSSPLFLAPGDRILFDGMRSVLTVTRATGEVLSPEGTWGVRCGSAHPGPRA
ncbi:hypothetical protein ACFYUY_24345 [Kitasatospora sp. NPDC004745]|uniref:hypothetical protein n=1 Tax=Kitasatospora sp. NPDC004745 TaxID=3364019 RepID=UPI0036843E5D